MKSFVRLSAGSFLLFIILSLCGCATYLNLTMKKDSPLTDRSFISPKLQEKKITKVVIIPPAGIPRRDLENKIMLFEREFLKWGITVISGDVTGRVVMDAIENPKDKEPGAARELSDMERALALQKASGADLILQLTEFRWVFPQAKTRYFIGDKQNESDFKEVGYDEWLDWSGPKRDFLAPKWIFAGRAVDASSGEVLALYDFSLPANFVLPEDYLARYIYTPVEDRATKTKLIAEYSFHYDGNSWLPSAMERTEKTIVERVVSTMSARANIPQPVELPAPSIEKPPVASKETVTEKTAEQEPETAARQEAVQTEAMTAPPPPELPAASTEKPLTASKNLTEDVHEQNQTAKAEREVKIMTSVPATVKKLYAVQIKAYESAVEAKEFASAAKQKLSGIKIIKATIKNKGVWYRIVIGPFPSIKDAISYQNQKGIRRLYPDSFIRRISLPPRNKTVSKHKKPTARKQLVPPKGAARDRK